LKTPPDTISRHAMRTNLLASATATSLSGFCSMIFASQGEALVFPFRICRSSAVVPTMSVDLIDGSPAFVMPPKRVRPPVEWSFGVNPSQAAKWRPDLNVSAGGAFMLSIVEPIGTPGTDHPGLSPRACLCRGPVSALKQEGLLHTRRREESVLHGNRFGFRRL
jgi:hypothetical protein